MRREVRKGNDMGFHFSGDMQVISQIVDDGAGHLSFLVNVDGDLFGSTHNGTVRADGPVFIVSEQVMDGAANWFSQTNGNIYQWRVQAGGTVGWHMVIELEQQDTTYSAQGGAPAAMSAAASLPQAATSAGTSLPEAASDSAVTASGGEGESATTDSPEA